MNLVGWMDSLSLLISLVTIALLLRYWRKAPLAGDIKNILLFIIGVGTYIHLSNFLEWNGITSGLDPAEDYFDLAYPILWGGVFYVFLHDWVAKQLLEEKQRLQQYMDVVGVMIIIVDQNEHITFINPAGLGVLETTEQEIVKKNIFENFILEEDRTRLRDIFKRIFSGQIQQTARGETRIITPRGLRLVSWTATRLDRGEGQKSNILCSVTDITASRELEDTLTVVKAQERALIDNLPHLAWVKDTMGRFILVNKNFAKACGHDIRDIIGRTDLDVWPHHLAESYRADDESVIRTRTAKFVEEPISTPGGQRWFETYKSPVFDPSGRVIGTTGMSKDITERRLAAEKLRQSEEKLRSIFRAAPVGIGVEINRMLTEANERMCDMTGYLRDELVGQSARILYLTQEDFDYVGRVKYTMLKERGRGELETRWRKKDGEVIDVLLSSTPIDPNDWSRGVTFAALDITSRKIIERVVREKTEELEKYFECAMGLLCIADTDGYFRRLNPQWEKVLGYKISDLIGQRYSDFVHPDDRALTQSIEEELSNNKEVVSFVNRFRCRDGSYRWLEWKSFPVGKMIYATAYDITDRMQAEKKMRESEGRFRTLFENMMEGVALHEVIYDAAKNPVDYRIYDVNPAYARHTGIKIETVRGKLGSEVYGSMPPPLLKEFSAVAESGKASSMEIFYEPLKRHFNLSVISTKIGHFATVFEDITERKKVELELRGGEAKLRQVIDLVPHFIFAKNRQGQFILANKAVADNYGTSVENLLGKTDADFDKNPEEVEHFIKDDLEVIEGGVPKDIPEEKITDSQQQVHYLHTIKIPFKVASTGDPAVLGVSTDITERKLMILALQESEEKYRSLVEAANDAIFIADAKTGVLVDVNRAASELIGLPREKLIGMHQAELHPKGEAQHYREVFQQQARPSEGKSSQVFGFVAHREKGRIPVQISVTRIDLHGQKLLMGIFRDITEIKLIEDALRQDKQSLQTAVQEQTENLHKTMRQLEDARRLSDIGALAATVAHELRNPLGVIKTAVYNVRRKAGNPDLEKHLDNVDKKIAESERIIKNLLTYAQIKAPKYMKANVLDVLNECVENCRHRYTTMRVEVSVRQKAGKTSLLVEMDSLHLSEVFMNVLDNAYQSFEEQQGRIDIDLGVDEKKRFFQVKIADNGIGIDKEIIPKIFDPFFTTRARGTGLGLSVCNQIMNLYDGRIDIQSAKGKGTTVTILLPLPAEKEGHDASSNNPARG